MKRRQALALALATATTAALAATAAPAHAQTTKPLDYRTYRNYGSGSLANWDQISTRTQSPDTLFSTAHTWVYGDSITKADSADLTTRLAQVGIRAAVDAQGGIPTAPAVERLAYRVARHGPPPVLVMATGTNDIFNPTLIAAQTRRARTVVGPTTRIVWVNAYVARGGNAARKRLDAGNTGRVNTAIRYAPNARVVDWAGFITAKPFRAAYYLRDGVHTTTAGRGARNALIVDAVLAAK